jgi:flagellar basal-body rod modification protein FlgD
MIGSVNNNPLFFIGNYAGSEGGDIGQEDFLTMLLVQLQNQDPMNVMSQAEFTTQLTQLSSLEQLRSINENIAGSLNGNALLTNSLNNSLATTLIDKTVKAYGNQLNLDDSGDVNCAFRLAGDAEKVSVKIYDGEGDLVRTMEFEKMDEGQQVVSWNGEDNGGSRLSSGEYTFKVEAYDGEDQAINVDHYLYGRVEAVSYKNGMAVLIVNGLEVDIADVFEVLSGEDDISRR